MKNSRYRIWSLSLHTHTHTDNHLLLFKGEIRHVMKKHPPPESKRKKSFPCRLFFFFLLLVFCFFFLPGRLVVILGAVGGFVLAGQRFKQVEHHVGRPFFLKKNIYSCVCVVVVEKKQKESRSLVKSRTHTCATQRWRPPVSLPQGSPLKPTTTT